MGILLFASFLCLGIAMAHRLFAEQSTGFRYWSGTLMGIAGMMWLVVPFAFWLGFGHTSHFLALAAMTGLYLLAARTCRARPAAGPGISDFDWTALAFAVPLLLFSAYLFHTHVLMPHENGGLYVGQSTFGDLSLHLGIITSIAEQGRFPPEYSIFQGHLLSYPFLVDSLSSSLYLFGTPLRWAVILPSLVLMMAVLWGFPVLAYEVTKNKAAAVLAAVLFFFNGGFGFAYFFEDLADNPGNFDRIFTAFYQTPTNLVGENLRWVNVICDMLIPQRTTLAGWAFLIWTLWLLHHAIRKGGRRYYAACGVAAGLMPMIHTHSFLGLGLVSAAWFFAYLGDNGSSTRRAYVLNWVLYGAIALALAMPQLYYWTFRQAAEGDFVKWHFDWANDRDNWLWFWIKNVGPVFLLLPPALLAATKNQWRFYSGAVLIFLIADVFLFQPNSYDNNKLFYVWYLLTCILVADYAAGLYTLLEGRRERLLLAAGMLLACTLSALLTMGREAVSSYRLFNADEVAAADFIRRHTPKDSVFLTSDNHNNAVAVLTGRNIVLGTSSFLYFHGIHFEQRAADVANLFRHPDESKALLEQYGIDYVYFSDYEAVKFGVDGKYFFRNFPVMFRSGPIAVFSVSGRAASAQ